MANILFIKAAKSTNELPTISPPLGILYLISYLRSHRSGDNYDVFDRRLDGFDDDALDRRMKEFVPDVIGISSCTIEESDLSFLAKRCKEISPKSIVVAGGPHPTSFGDRVLEIPHVDFIVKGEGEISFLKLVDAIEKQSTKEIAGVSYRNSEGRTVSIPHDDEWLDPDNFQIPAWDVIDVNAYQTCRMAPIAQGPYLALFTSRGCPYRCTYCHNIFGKKYRALRPERVVDEIEYLVGEYGINEFEIYDDAFNLDYNRTIEICEEIERRGLTIRMLFPNGVRTDLLDERLIKKLRQAGTIYMSIAVETASDRIQKEIKKNLDLGKVFRNIKYASDEGIYCWGFFMMGFPDESRGELFKTIIYALRSRLQGAFFFSVIPQEGTELARIARESVSRRTDRSDTEYMYYKNNLSKMSAMELRFWQLLTTMIFFFNPYRIYTMFRNYPYSYKLFFVKSLDFVINYIPEIIFSNIVNRIRRIFNIEPKRKVRGKLRRPF